MISTDAVQALEAFGDVAPVNQTALGMANRIRVPALEAYSTAVPTIGIAWGETTYISII
jgi:hypothetical protein